jgi:hypothetical protein
MKVRVTHNLDEEVEGIVTEIYIKRLKARRKVTRSDIVAEALMLLWEKEKPKTSK